MFWLAIEIESIFAIERSELNRVRSFVCLSIVRGLTSPSHFPFSTVLHPIDPTPAVVPDLRPAGFACVQRRTETANARFAEEHHLDILSRTRKAKAPTELGVADDERVLRHRPGQVPAPRNCPGGRELRRLTHVNQHARRRGCVGGGHTLCDLNGLASACMRARRAGTHGSHLGKGP